MTGKRGHSPLRRQPALTLTIGLRRHAAHADAAAVPGADGARDCRGALHLLARAVVVREPLESRQRAVREPRGFIFWHELLLQVGVPSPSCGSATAELPSCGSDGSATALYITARSLSLSRLSHGSPALVRLPAQAPAGARGRLESGTEVRPQGSLGTLEARRRVGGYKVQFRCSSEPAGAQVYRSGTEASALNQRTQHIRQRPSYSTQQQLSPAILLSPACHPLARQSGTCYVQ